MVKYKRHAIIFILFTFLLAIIIKSAWICDDAYISFRYIKNLFNGHGLRWNVGERVQAFTNPLYVLCIMPLYAVSKNMYLSSIILSILLTMFAVMIVLYSKKKRNISLLIFFIVILSCSKAFIDYSTSGLENSMTFLLLAIFFRYFFDVEAPYHNDKFFRLCIVASLIAINRIDCLVIVVVPLIYLFIKNFSFRKIYLGLLGFAPFIVWEIFSLVYYGFLIPNTAVAKLNNTTNLWSTIEHGIRYIQATILYGDYITIAVILFAVIIGLSYLKKNCRYSLAAFGILGYVLYIVYIGGDFMLGRFLSTPFFLAVVLLYSILKEGIAKSKIETRTLRKYAAIITLVVFIIGCMTQTSTITSKIKYDETKSYIALDYNKRPCDERAYYYKDAGLAYYLANIYVSGYDPNRALYKWGRLGRFLEEDAVYRYYSVGFRGYFCPDRTTIIDSYGLTEPLLARIPAAPNQRVGHYIRLVPNGYKETLETGINVISNPDLREYYDKLHLIVSGKIFSWERIKAIFEMNTGKYDYLMDRYTESVEYEKYLDEIFEELNN